LIADKDLRVWRVVYPFHFSGFFDLDDSFGGFYPVHHFDKGFLFEGCFECLEGFIIFLDRIDSGLFVAGRPGLIGPAKKQ